MKVIEFFNGQKNETGIVSFDKGIVRWVEVINGEIIVLSDLYEIPIVEKIRGDSGKSSLSYTNWNIIEHQRFGLGKVMKIYGMGDQIKVSIVFDDMGIKELLIKFASIR